MDGACKVRWSRGMGGRQAADWRRAMGQWIAANVTVVATHVNVAVDGARCRGKLRLGAFNSAH